MFDVPLDYSLPELGRIRLFARSVLRRSSAPESDAGEKQLPWFLYLQGGPGMPCSQPQDLSWVSLLIDRGYQVCISYVHVTAP
jgi:proline iminopeptidase